MNSQVLKSKKNRIKQAALLAMSPIARYHKHEVRGIGNIPKAGPCIIVINHSLATYDGFLLGAKILNSTNREMWALGDDLIFKFNMLGKLAHSLGIVPAHPDSARKLLEDDFLVGVAPGGMHEALRSSKYKYRVDWRNRKGFVRLAIETGAPVILAACPQADDLYTVYPSIFTKIGYKGLRIPIPLARGIGPTLIPRPVKLIHTLSLPILPPKKDPQMVEEQVNLFHGQLLKKMNEMLNPENSSPSTAP